MKEMLLYTQAFFLLFIVSCSGGKNTYSSYEYVNASDYAITIKTYNYRENIGLVDSIYLPKNGGTWKSNEFETTEGLEGVLSVLNADSLVVIYDNIKAESYSYSTDSGEVRNLVYSGNFELIPISSVRNKRRFTFTNEDYNNAEEIGGG